MGMFDKMLAASGVDPAAMVAQVEQLTGHLAATADNTRIIADRLAEIATRLASLELGQVNLLRDVTAGHAQIARLEHLHHVLGPERQQMLAALAALQDDLAARRAATAQPRDGGAHSQENG